MSLFPLFVVISVTAIMQQSLPIYILFGVLSLISYRGQSIYAKLGVALLTVMILIQSFPESLPRQETIFFSIESRRENGASVRLYGSSGQEEGVLLGRELAIGQPGETCQVNVRYVPFKPLRNIGGFDEAKWAESAHLSFKGEIENVTSCEPTSGMNGRMLRWKEKRLQRIERLYRADVALYIEALCFGESRLLDEETSFSYRVTGLLHLLVISGSHIAILILGLRWVMKILPLRRETKTILIILFITAFGWLTGFSPPVARAVLVADVILSLSLFGVSIRDPIRLLSWCAAFLLAYQPFLLGNLGFQLTVGMTFFLLVTKQIWRGMLDVSVYAQLAGLIVLWPVQSIISLVAPLLNVLMAFLISWVIMPFALVTWIFPSVERYFVYILDSVNGMFKFHDVYRPWLPLHELSIPYVFGLSIGIWGGLVLMEKKRWMGWSCAILTVITIYMVTELFERPRVTFLDVGQGDAIVIEQRDTIGLIDVGGVFQDPNEEKRSVFDPGEDVIAPYVWKRGERELDFVLLTHADHDHIGGLKGLLENISVREIWLSKEVADKEKREGIVRLAREYGTEIRLFGAGDRPFKWLWIVSPIKRFEGENENSMSVYLEVGEMRYLLTGDLPVEQEESLPIVDVDVFKLGHHGSNTSSSEQLIEQIDPEWVIASVGQDNRYGHPHPETLRRLKGRRLLRTDVDGMIVCEEKICRGIIE